ncbi:MAG: hypothetical protein SVS85_04195, partial [Candidatus Nanohaloarchaea archaeon]|nr:hypothetical protein [Candidatus Nanohaloarchaea archaeon]
MEETVEIPEGVEASYDDGVLEVEKDGREVEKKLEHAQVDVDVSSDEVTFSTDAERKNITSIVKTFRSHTE